MTSEEYTMLRRGLEATHRQQIKIIDAIFCGTSRQQSNTTPKHRTPDNTADYGPLRGAIKREIHTVETEISCKTIWEKLEHAKEVVDLLAFGVCEYTIRVKIAQTLRHARECGKLVVVRKDIPKDGRGPSYYVYTKPEAAAGAIDMTNETSPDPAATTANTRECEA
jgi:hypothetical protein